MHTLWWQDVYNKVWLPEAGEGEPMRVIYRYIMN